VKLAVLMLAFIGSYRLADFTMGVMSNPFYLDVGFTLKEIAPSPRGSACSGRSSARWSAAWPWRAWVSSARLALGSVLVIIAT